MKKYRLISEMERKQTAEQRLFELKTFQYLLRTCPPLNTRYYGKAAEIADGLQPWIEALERMVKE